MGIISFIFCSPSFAWNKTSTIREVTYDDWTVFGGTTNHTVNIMVTPNVVVSVSQYIYIYIHIILMVSL